MSTAEPDPRKLVKTKYAGIFQKGNRYQVRYRHHGKQVARSFRTLTEARKFKGSVDSGDAQPTSRRPFDSYARDWIATYTGRTSRGLSETTRELYRDSLERFAIKFFGTQPLDTIDPPRIRQFIAWLDKRLGSPASVRANLAPVRAMFGTAFDDGHLRMNPAAGVRVNVADKREKTPQWLTAEQTKILLAEIPSDHADLVYLLATTGLRISEVLALRWRDVSVDTQPNLTVTRSKTRAGLRTIAITPEAMRRLTKRRSSAAYAADDDLVFPTRFGTGIDPRNFRTQVFRPAAERAGVEWATPHNLRHGMASLMASQGLSAAEIAAHLGHADGGVLALRTYIHPQRTSVDFIDKALGPEKEVLRVDQL